MMTDRILTEDEAYIIELRRKLHRYPEEEFDLPVTIGIICKELDLLDITYTHKFGKSSIVADVGGFNKGPTVALRADMDALPVTEQTGLSFSSEHEGYMHACGHDCHMAMAVGLLRMFKRDEKNLPFRFRVIFEPCEECDVSGGRMLVENGVLDGVDAVIAQHMAPDIDTGYIGVSRKEAASSCCPVNIKFTGLSAHASKPHTSHDALAMAIHAYNGIMLRIARGINPAETFVCSISCLQAGFVHNVVPASAMMKISIRGFNEDTMAFAVDRIKAICADTAAEFGGTAEVQAEISSHATINDEKLSEMLLKSAESILGVDKSLVVEPRLSSDDFAWYCNVRPAVYFWNGTRNLEKWPEKALHNNDFMVDERSFRVGVSVITQFLYDYADNWFQNNILNEAVK